MLKNIIALAVVAAFGTAAYAQGQAAAPATPAKPAEAVKAVATPATPATPAAPAAPVAKSEEKKADVAPAVKAEAKPVAKSEEKKAAILQGHVEDTEKVLLQDGLEIDEQVAAADKIQTSEWRVLKDIVRGEDDHFAQIVIYCIFVVFLREITAQTADRDILGNVFPIDALAGSSNRVGVQIRGENFYAVPQVEFFHGFHKKDGNGIGFLA